jgi:hypothetical protein
MCRCGKGHASPLFNAVQACRIAKRKNKSNKGGSRLRDPTATYCRIPKTLPQCCKNRRASEPRRQGRSRSLATASPWQRRIWSPSGYGPKPLQVGTLWRYDNRKRLFNLETGRANSLRGDAFGYGLTYGNFQLRGPSILNGGLLNDCRDGIRMAQRDARPEHAD